MSSSIWESNCSDSCSSDSILLSASCDYFFFFNLYLIINASKDLSLCLSVLLGTGDFKVFTLTQMKPKL